MTKSEKIVALYKKGRSTREISMMVEASILLVTHVVKKEIDSDLYKERES